MITVSTSKSYHHGDLRAALLEAGLRHLETGGEADISLRQLARETGVSPTAVYRHFPDKRALLAALADEGMRRLGAAQQAALEAAGGGPKGFAATGRAYVRFALAEPALFRLAFTHAELVENPLEGGDQASRLLQANALALAHGDAERARTLALQAWSVAHGLAMLMLDGRVAPNDAVIDAVIDSWSPIAPQGSSSEASP
ncbi:MAG: TetR/AcrR family transcriptional regulator [Novosphingobium sp.]